MHIHMHVSNYVVCCHSNWKSDARVSKKVWIKNNKAKGWRNPLGKIRFAGANKCGSLTGSCLMPCTAPSSNWQHVTGKSKSQYLLYLRSCDSAGSKLHNEQSTGQREATEKAKRKTAPSLMLYAPVLMASTYAMNVLSSSMQTLETLNDCLTLLGLIMWAASSCFTKRLL